MDWDQARFFMIEQQIRPWEVLNAAVLDELAVLKRENFVPPSKKEWAFIDMELPLGVNGTTMLQPKMEARIVQSVTPQPTDKVLVIGAGSGYLAGLLSRLTQVVYAVDIEPELVKMAQMNLQRAYIRNVTVALADGSTGVKEYAPYDIIVVTASMPFLNEELKNQLKEGGRLFAVLGEAPDMKATLVTRYPENQWEEKHLFETVLPRLVNVSQSVQFIF